MLKNGKSGVWKMTKEECEKAIDNVARYCSDYKYCMIPPRFGLINELNVLMSLIQEHFELVELLKPHGYGMLSAEEFEHWISYICKHNADNDMIIMSQNEQLEQIKNPQPYKYEDLKPGMWVWDDKSKCCFKCNPAISKIGTRCVTYNSFWYNCGEDEDEFFEEYDEFEEGRFFPITKALEYQE